MLKNIEFSAAHVTFFKIEITDAFYLSTEKGSYILTVTETTKTTQTHGEYLSQKRN